MSLAAALGLACLCAVAVAVLLLMLRDTHGRFNLRMMFLITALAAAAIWAFVEMIRVTTNF